MALGAAGCGGGGSMPGDDLGTTDATAGRCTVVADCAASACATVDCVDSVCVTTPLSDGPAPASEQSPGDCRQVMCVAGVASNDVDDSDLPATNACATASCDGGVPVVTPVPLGTACNEDGGSVCNGDNLAPACVGCNAPADCTGLPEDDECQTRVCEDHVCSQTFTDAGTPLALQTPRDCQELQCDGAGGVTSVARDSDLPDDLNDCTEDLCNQGVPSNPPLSVGTGCGDGSLSCDGAGQCVGCADPSECGDASFCAAFTCDAGVCGRAFASAGSVAPAGEQNPGDCQTLICDGQGGLSPIAEDTDVPQDDGDECTAQACVDGAPMFPPAAIDTPCASGGSYCDGSGACVGCNTGSHCGTDTPCVRYVCAAHACAVVVAPMGTSVPAGSQTPGDCQVLTCDGAGGAQSRADNMDVPVDGNACTNDVCTNGTPSNPPTNTGGVCGDGSQMCNDTGLCQSCFSDSDCTGSTFCAPVRCLAGSCVTQPLAPGSPLPSEDQQTGDCQRLECDGAGGTQSSADNGDLPPDDSNECTQPACNAGMPTTTPLQTGTGCGSGDVCDGSGVCVECNADAECGTSTECRQHLCVNHACTIQDVTAGTPTPTQTPGDCQQVRCDGNGGTMSVSANTDLPDDQNTCTADSCNAGAPQHTVTPNVACGTMGVCAANGSCVGCNTAADCGTDSFCRSYSCVANTCQVNNTAANTTLPAGSQVPADCRSVVCDGAGGTTTTPDPVDVPADDGNECTVSACMGSTPTQNPTSVGVPCNGGADLCNGNGSCVECLAASDCGFDSFCAQFACVNNTCQQTNTTAGVDLPAGSQTANDCQVIECDGAGNERSVALNADVPVDGNPCTNDVCTAGVPSNPPTSVNSACNVNGGTYCDGGGQCVACNMASQCGTNTFCQTFTCTGGTCGTAPTAVGTPLPTQTAGDCQVQQCNGMGGTRSVANDLDLPNDNNECTDDICSLGVPSNPNRLVNTGCAQNGGTYCNGAGSCVQCNAASQCGTNTFCAQFACNAGTCQQNNTGAGVSLPAASQSPGDCQVLECNGLGAVRSVALNTDVPSDGNTCTQDLCTAGVPSNPNRPVDFVCRPGDYCDGNGNCVDCNNASQCGTATFCQSFTCTNKTCGTVNTPAATALPPGSQTTGDCKVVECDGIGSPRTVALNTDVFVDGNQCTDDICTAGTPSNPPSAMGAACMMGGNYCNGAGSCRECLTDAHCGTSTFCHTYTCNAGTCSESFAAMGATLPTGQTVGDCQSLVCNGTGGVTSTALNSDLPNDSNSCTNDTCVAGTPTFTNRANGTACGMNGMCLNGGCVGCVAASDCGVSDFCVTYTCSAMNTCQVSYTANGTPLPGQVAGDCQRLECDGAGATVSRAFNSDLPVDGNQCTSDVCTAGVPSNPILPLNTPCGSGDFCNGSGTCVDCNSAAQCGTSTFCQTFTCNSNTCGVSNTANNTPLPGGSQTAGDCRELRCNGAGGTTNAVLNSDLPNDNNQCTTDTCSAGTPTFTNVAINTACGSGDFCNGSGACVDCNMASQCGTSTFCQTFTCNSNMCGVSNTPNNTPLPGGSQVAGNCRELRCNGIGGTNNAILDSDLPVDGNPCTNDVCTNGTPTNPNSAINTPCGSGDFCNGSGTCVDCTTATQCPNGNQCQSRTCTGNTCGLSNLANGTSCNDGLFCTQTDTCNGAGTCNGSGTPCNQCQNCNEGSDTCSSKANGTACNDGLFCTQTDTCTSGNCNGVTNPCDSQCQSCNEAFNFCSNTSPGVACGSPASGRNNVCWQSQCDGSGTCGYRTNRFGGSMTANSSSYNYTNVASFSPCTDCHGFAFTEAWSESSSYSPEFDSYCVNWGSNADRFYYGNRRAGCVLQLLDDGIMPDGSPRGAWAWDDEYLQWYCSASGPGGSFGW
ncbi:MAG: hypothetical protein H6725_14580 [Sandaracinaceae bacterium]|nr:hypothetical protein [Sandaracinaceae bacterium]